LSDRQLHNAGEAEQGCYDFGKNRPFLVNPEPRIGLVAAAGPAAPFLDVLGTGQVREPGEGARDPGAEAVAGDAVILVVEHVAKQAPQDAVQFAGGEKFTGWENEDRIVGVATPHRFLDPVVGCQRGNGAAGAGEGEEVDELALLGSGLGHGQEEEDAAVRPKLDIGPFEGGGGIEAVLVLGQELAHPGRAEEGGEACGPQGLLCAGTPARRGNFVANDPEKGQCHHPPGVGGGGGGGHEEVAGAPENGSDEAVLVLVIAIALYLVQACHRRDVATS